MASMNDVFVDYNAGTDSGATAGTVGDPFQTLQYALDNTTRDADGDIFNIEDTSAQPIPAGGLNLDTGGSGYLNGGALSSAAPIGFRGYSAAANDGGKATCEGTTNSAANMFSNGAIDYVYIKDLIFTGFSAECVNVRSYCSIDSCRFTNSAEAIDTNSYCWIHNNQLDTLSGSRGISALVSPHIWRNWILIDAADGLGECIWYNSLGATISQNIISITGAASTVGITVSQNGGAIIGNTIDGGGLGTGQGIRFDASTHYATIIANNIITNFGGTGGDAIDLLSATTALSYYGGNAFYGNTNNETNFVDAAKFGNPATPDNEVLAVDPYLRHGANTFANRDHYWGTKPLGNLRGGAFAA